MGNGTTVSSPLFRLFIFAWLLSGIKISDCTLRKDREKLGRLIFSNGHEIACRMPQPGSNFEGLNIRWSNKKNVTWIKVVFDRVKPDSANPSVSETAIF